MTTDLTPTARRTSRLAFLGLSVVLVAAGCAAASTPSPAVSPASNGSAAPAMGASAVAPGVPTTIDSASSATSAASGGAAGSAGSAGAGAAALYPYPGFAGTPGLAPDHTIVVAGSGQAMMKTDLSDRAKAERSAIDAALADARAQATAVASAAGVTLGGVLSVSVSTSDSYGIAMGVSNVEPPTAAGGPSTTLPTPVRAQPTSPELFVSVTVEYQIG